MIFGRIFSRCNHIQRITIPTNIVNIVVVVSEIAIALPMSPNNPHRRKNHPILPAWNVNCVLICCLVQICVSPYSVNPITILPTIARQVETDAMIPINKATHSDRLSPIEGRYWTIFSL